MVSDMVSTLNRKIKKIRSLQREESEQKGKRKQLMLRLSDEFEVDSLDNGADLLDEYVKTVEANDTTIERVEGDLDEIIRQATKSKKVQEEE